MIALNFAAKLLGRKVLVIVFSDSEPLKNVFIGRLMLLPLFFVSSAVIFALNINSKVYD